MFETFLDAVTSTLVLYLIAKSAISASFLIIYPFSGELYPTQVRGLGIGVSSYVAGLGLIVIPFITYLVCNCRFKTYNLYFKSIPYISIDYLINHLHSIILNHIIYNIEQYNN